MFNLLSKWGEGGEKVVKGGKKDRKLLLCIFSVL